MMFYLFLLLYVYHLMFKLYKGNVSSVAMMMGTVSQCLPIRVHVVNSFIQLMHSFDLSTREQ